MTPPPPGQKTMEAGGVAHAIWTGGQHNGLQAIPGVPKWHPSIKLGGGKIATLQAALVTAKWCGAWRKPGFF